MKPRNLDAREIDSLLDDMAASLTESLGDDRDNCLMLGLETGGLWIAQALHTRLGLASELGSINVNFYRDDFSRVGLHPNVGASRVPAPVDDRNVVIVDDVLYTGRTVRAAMNEIFDFGRPSRLLLAVLIDRGGRELPVQADVVGETWEIRDNQQIDLSGPEPLAVQVKELPA